MPHQTILYCRVGFEADLIAELASVRPDGAASSLQAGLVQWTAAAGNALRWRELVFARDLMHVAAEISQMDPGDRLAPINSALQSCQLPGAARVLCADSEQGKPLLPLAQALEKRLGQGPIAAPGRQPVVLLLSSTSALVGWREQDNASPFPGGVARLKFPREAPSRSTLKLEEAFLVLLSETDQDRLLQAGGSAVDLGAAPGGWTWQMVRRGIRVTAIDNGPMDSRLLDSGMVTHLRQDGLRYQPAKTVDWLICDMVEKPARVVELVLRWFDTRRCRAAIFNLKLPMKRRNQAWQDARSALTRLSEHGIRLSAKQLYHDREEITVALIPRIGRRAAKAIASRSGPIPRRRP